MQYTWRFRSLPCLWLWRHKHLTFTNRNLSSKPWEAVLWRSRKRAKCTRWRYAATKRQSTLESCMGQNSLGLQTHNLTAPLKIRLTPRNRATFLKLNTLCYFWRVNFTLEELSTTMYSLVDIFTFPTSGNWQCVRICSSRWMIIWGFPFVDWCAERK